MYIGYIFDITTSMNDFQKYYLNNYVYMYVYLCSHR